jgi:hypothetical protein
MDISLVQLVSWPDGVIRDLYEEGVNHELCRRLSGLIPPGGHLMVSYEGEEPMHRETAVALSKGIPPVLTPLGALLFDSGFLSIKDWYLSEGGHEGPRKLWGEKPANQDISAEWGQRLRAELQHFLGNPVGRQSAERIPPFRRLAEDILVQLMPHEPLPSR